MSEYIERGAALDKCGWYNTVNGKSICAARKDELVAIPAADAVGVKHGRWEWYKSPVCLSGDIYYRCSVCGESDPWQLTTRGNANYCPNCGAKMDGDSDA